MDLWQPNNFPLFLIFFVPGFISLKVYDLMVPNIRRDFSKSVIDIIVYSCINFILFYYPVVTFIHVFDLYHESNISDYVLIVVLLFVIPLSLPIILRKMASIKPISNIIIHPVLKPWDFKFNQRDSSLILVHLKNGDMIGGLFDFNSFASSYPADEQLYLEKVWKINENGNFEKPINRSKGINYNER